MTQEISIKSEINFPELMTADELLKISDDSYRYELVKGELRKMPPAGSEHGVLTLRLAWRLAQHVEKHELGVFFAAETGFRIKSDPDTVRAPDTAEDRENPQILKHICRIGFELGADILKVPYTGDVETFREAVDICPLPIVILGGAKMATERDALVTVAEAIEAGAIGVAFGRNVFQHPNPTGMIKALRKVIHERTSVDDALTLL